MKNEVLLSETDCSLITKFIDEKGLPKVIKKYKSNNLHDARKEFLFLKTVEHPGIVKAYSYGFDNLPYLITDHLEGNTLAESDLKMLDLNSIMLSLAESLAYIHSCGICLNDLNANNIIIHNNYPTIIDFSLASVNLHFSNEFAGTFSFSAPEKMLHYTNHFASDIFSLGMIYFYLLYNKTILDFYDNNAYLNLMKDPELWTESLNRITNDELLLKMLSYNPSERPSALVVFSHFNLKNTKTNPLINEIFIKSYIFKSQLQAVQKLWKKKTLFYQYTDEPQKLENLLSLLSENENKKLLILDEKLFVNNPDEFFKAFPIGYRDKEVYHHKLLDWLLAQEANILLKRSSFLKESQLFNDISTKFEVFTMIENDNSEIKPIPYTEISELINNLNLNKDLSLSFKNQLKNSKAFFTRLYILKSISSKYKKDNFNELLSFLQWINVSIPLSFIELIWENWFNFMQDGLLSQTITVDGELVKSDSSLRYKDEISPQLLDLILEKIKNTNYHFILGRIYYLLKQNDKAIEHWNIHLDYLIQQQYFMSAYEFIQDISKLLNYANIPFEMKKKEAFISRIVGKFEEALHKYQSLIDESEGVLKAILSCDLAIVLQALKRNDAAIDIYKKAIDLFKVHKDWKSLFRAMNNLGVVYFGLKKYTDAESLFNDVLLQAKILNNLQFETISYLNLADINCKRGEWKKALFHSEKAIQIAEINNKWNLVANGKIISAKCYYALGEFEKAISLLEALIEQPQSKENHLVLQEIQAWLIHFYANLDFNKIAPLLEAWNLPSPEMHEILIRELFFYYYFSKSYQKASYLAQKMAENTIFAAFLDSDIKTIESRLKELKIQNEHDSYLYYLTHLLKSDIIGQDSQFMADIKDDLNLFDYKPAEICCIQKNSDFEPVLLKKIAELSDSITDIITMFRKIIPELIPYLSFERFVYFENQQGFYNPVIAYDKFSREFSSEKLIFSQNIIKQIISKQGLIYESFLLNSDSFSVHSSVIGLGIRSVLAYCFYFEKECIGFFYADSSTETTLNSKQLNIIESFLKIVTTFIEKYRLELERKERINLTHLDQDSETNWKIIGNSKIMDEVFNKIRMVAGYNVNVLITGPTGSGKELVSKAIHQLYIEKNPASKKAPFIAVNCAAIPEQLLESELFGHKRGSFTGAVTDQKGKILEANHGTIFLDEIGEMPLILQAKLLRVIQDKEVVPLGSSTTIPVSVRIITATNKNLEEQVNLNLFRADLYYRLKVMTIQLPSLSERIEDIPLLVMHFLKKFNLKFNKNITAIQPKTMNYFQQKEWKGNIRELENEIERAVLMCNKDYLAIEDILEVNENNNISDFSHLPLSWQEYKDYRQKINDELDSKYAKQLLDNAEGNVSLASKIGNLDRVQIYRLLKGKS